MNNRTITILVVVSLLLNIVLLSLFLYYRLETRPLLDQIPRLHHHPPRFEDFLKMSREEIEGMRADFELTRKKFVEALSSPVYNPDTLKSMLDTTLEKQLEMEMLLGEKMIELRGKMSPEEALQFFMRERPIRERIRNQIQKFRDNREKFRRGDKK